tara:strand:+ start:8315 stop:8695 length:381 start_codon:yes stop_codon:yes gene_type:complete
MPNIKATQIKLVNIILLSIVTTAIFIGWLAACSSEPDNLDPLVKRGKVVYRNNCTACHAPDPTNDGGLGPAVDGSSLELLTARIVHGNYPEGYEPRKKTGIMVALPFLEPEIPALVAYLNQESFED